jgi:hypothetical protein
VSAAELTAPVIIERDGVVLLAGEAGTVVRCLRAIGDRALADRVVGYLRHARSLRVALDSSTREITVTGTPRHVTFTSAGGAA